MYVYVDMNEFLVDAAYTPARIPYYVYANYLYINMLLWMCLYWRKLNEIIIEFVEHMITASHFLHKYDEIIWANVAQVFWVKAEVDL